jgi:hypothetical protein
VFPEIVGTTLEREYRTAATQQITVTFEAFYAPLEKWFEVHSYPFNEGLTVVFNDITKRKQTEAE